MLLKKEAFHEQFIENKQNKGLLSWRAKSVKIHETEQTFIYQIVSGNYCEKGKTRPRKTHLRIGGCVQACKNKRLIRAHSQLDIQIMRRSDYYSDAWNLKEGKNEVYSFIRWKVYTCRMPHEKVRPLSHIIKLLLKTI